jgi:hypothetical protein
MAGAQPRHISRRNGGAGRPFCRGLRSRQRAGHSARRAAPFLLFDDRDELVVATLGGESERRGRDAMGPDALPRVGALLHEEPDDVRSPAEHGVVKRSMLVVLRDVEVHELGASDHHRPHGVEIAGANGLDEPPHRDAVDERLQLGPAVEAVGARHDELRVMESEGSAQCRAAVSALFEFPLGFDTAGLVVIM